MTEDIKRVTEHETEAYFTKLRDEIAMRAMECLININSERDCDGVKLDDYIAKNAYIMADAMLAARVKP